MSVNISQPETVTDSNVSGNDVDLF